MSKSLVLTLAKNFNPKTPSQVSKPDILNVETFLFSHVTGLGFKGATVSTPRIADLYAYAKIVSKSLWSVPDSAISRCYGFKLCEVAATIISSPLGCI